MIIKRVFRDGSTDEVEFKNVKAFKKSPKSKDKNLIAAMVIDAITKIVIALIRLKFRNPTP
jgi:hypothetical protein